ncbi:hypothetical protein D3C76_1223530 [compost metagenome]
MDGKYQESEGLWQEVLRENSNFDLAYLAIGKSLYKAENYKEAMDYFKLARSRVDYSNAFAEFRKEWIREHFAWIIGGLVTLFLIIRYLLPVGWRSLRSKWNRKRNSTISEWKGGVAK